MPELTLEEARDNLKINRNALDEEVARVAVVFQAVAEQEAHAISNRDFLREEQKRIDGDLRPVLVKKIEARGDKVTEKALETELETDDRHIAARDAYTNASLNANLWGAMKEAHRVRSSALRDLAQLAIAGIYTGSSSVEGYESDRKALATARTARQRTRIDGKGT